MLRSIIVGYLLSECCCRNPSTADRTALLEGRGSAILVIFRSGLARAQMFDGTEMAG